MSSQQSILDRLAELERKDAAKTDEIRRLQECRQRLEDKVWSLQNDNIELKKENIKLKETNDHVEKRLSALEKSSRRINKNNQEMRTKNSTLTNKVNIVESTVSQLSGLQKVLNRCLVNKHDVNKKMDDLCQRTNAIETRQKNIYQSFASIRLDTQRQRKLSADQPTKLDRCDKVDVNRGVFDQKSCCLVPQCDGDFCVSVMYRQNGNGGVNMALYWDENGVEAVRFVGRTVNNDGECFGMQCLSLKKEQKVWLKATGHGKAEIWWCRVFFWLLS